MCLAGPVAAITAWHGGAYIAAAHTDKVLKIFRAGLVNGSLVYTQIAKVNLPDVPTDVAALHLPVPTLAIGCNGRYVCSDWAHLSLGCRISENFPRNHPYLKLWMCWIPASHDCFLTSATGRGWSLFCRLWHG